MWFILGYVLMVAAAGWFLYKAVVSYNSAGGTDFAVPVFDAAVYPPIMTAVGLYLVLDHYEIGWSKWIYVAIWLGLTAVAVGAIKLAEEIGDKPL